MEKTTEIKSKVYKVEQEGILRFIFLNIFISTFIVMCYFTSSEFFGSISTPFVKNNDLVLGFSFTLLIFTFFSILAGPYHGFIAGFIGEFFYQLAYYDFVYFEWCLIVALFGLIIGIYRYKPLKYLDGMNVYYSFIIILIAIFATMGIIIMIKVSISPSNLDTEQILINYGFKFLIQALATILFLVPILLVIYDRALAYKERHVYNLFLTHHPIEQDDHTFYLKFGRTYFYFCTRCTGIIMGGLIGIFFTHLIELSYNVDFSPEFAVLLCVILPIPGLTDWGTQRLLYRKSTTESRLMTGFIVGLALHMMSYTSKYTVFMFFLLIFYFSIFGLLMFFGQKKEMRLWREKYEEMQSKKDQ